MLSGYYIYMEASNQHQGDLATLISPVVRASVHQACLTFWYNMYGVQMGKLEVLTATPHLQHLNIIWERSRNQGEGWFMANVTIDTSHPVEVCHAPVKN